MAPGQFVAAGALPVIDSFFSGRLLCVFSESVCVCSCVLACTLVSLSVDVIAQTSSELVCKRACALD